MYSPDLAMVSSVIILSIAVGADTEKIERGAKASDRSGWAAPDESMMSWRAIDGFGTMVFYHGNAGAPHPENPCHVQRLNEMQLPAMIRNVHF
jgi:hypothetical protein